MEWETVVINNTKLKVHSRESCQRRYCCIHNPSNHHMTTWPQNWRSDRSMMERICQHGIGHPDPDDLDPFRVHGCDNCCLLPLSDE